ncbi:hypothetical protein [Paenisporosarcina sp. TG-14]|uniref:hypothetical protein n=1 Tax=Paenisporosarcina sp. TG-14 TaxID=1231057 RepID=UPI0002F4FF11|nr:hypothetical protein [Paenisporosarcina sp. TG-14]
MIDYQNALTGLLQLTEEILKQAKVIGSKMKDNETEQLETLQLLFDKRQLVIKQLDTYMQQAGFQWTQEDQLVIHKLKQYDQILQPLMTGLYQSFLTQMNQINQTKQVSKKYSDAYQNMTTDGSFIDKRK